MQKNPIPNNLQIKPYDLLMISNQENTKEPLSFIYNQRIINNVGWNENIKENDNIVIKSRWCFENITSNLEPGKRWKSNITKSCKPGIE